MEKQLDHVTLVYFPNMVQDKRFHWQITTAKTISRHLKVIHVSFVDSPIKFRQIFDRKIFRHIILQIISAKERNFTDWRIFHILPLGRFAFVNNINTVLNLILLRVLINGNVIFLTAQTGKTILQAKKILRPKITMGETFDIFSLNQFKDLYKAADSLLVNSEKARLEALKTTNNVHIVPTGFFSANTIEVLNKGNYHKSSNNIVYIGTLNWRSNFDFLIYIALQLKEFHITIIGPEVFDYDISPEFNKKSLGDYKIWQKLKTMKNVKYIPITNQEDILHIKDNFSVGIIPYDNKIIFNKYSHPIKFYLYSAMGLPIVSPKIYALQQYRSRHMFFANSKSKFIESIKLASKLKIQKDEKREMLRIALSHTYESKARKILEIINKTCL